MKKLEELYKSFKKLMQVFKEPNSEDGNAQAPYIEIVTATQSLRDTLSFMNTNKSFFKLVETSNGDVYWNGKTNYTIRANMVETKIE